MNNLYSLTMYRYFLLMCMCLLLQPGTASASVCQEGLGIPPFLSSGAQPNLLLVLDNSGSMLDTAYTDTTGDGACVDNDFNPDPAKTYAGLFDPEKWYQWKEGARQWQNGVTYTVDEFVYTEGVFYKAIKVDGPSTGADIDSDTNVTWERVHQIPIWTSGTTYLPKSFVQYKYQLYYSVSGGKASGSSIDEDTVNWVPVDSTWLKNKVYAIGDVVSDNGLLFKATKGGTSSPAASGVSDDTVVTWARLDEGYFEEVAYTSIDGAATAFSSASGGTYTYSSTFTNTSGGVAEKKDQLYIKIKSVTVDGTPTASGVTAFAASGNLLNWAGASKFDIQKKILTGGKYDEVEQELISQGRGCASRGFVKEVPVKASDTTDRVLTFSIRGHQEDDWIDSTDETTRFAVLGVSTEGFIGSSRQQACKTAIDEVAKGADASQGVISKNVGDCLAYSGNNPVLAASNAGYNHSIHTCWSIVKKGFDDPTDLGNVNEITNACQTIYDAGTSPATIDPSESGYMCSGLYNSAITNTSLRKGYVGRCWEPGSVPEGCKTVSCSAPYGVGNPRCYDDDLQYQCSGSYNSKQDDCNKAWTLVLVQDPDSSTTCAASNTIAKPAQWTDDVVGKDPTQCIQQAMWDYCGSLKIPEVIDPTDQLFNTGETWGMVGAMIDSGTVALFGSDRPLIVMKGYIKKPSAPKGIIHEVADDLRLGAMAFNDNGAATECESADPTDTIVKYCPKVGNRDGARIVSPIKAGDETTGDKKHVDFLASAINDIRATAWTPLAEAMFNALGYYGQNDAFRIDPADFPTALEDSAYPDPVEFWCQENYVLIITEGASTADVNAKVETMIKTSPAELQDSTIAVDQEGECRVSAAGQHYLYGSTFLDDLTFLGQNSIKAGVFATPTMPSDDGKNEDKRNITTYLVVTGTPNDDGTKDSECNAATLMNNAADNGGTKLLTGEDPAQLEANLKYAFSAILSRASAGSAASVISSSRSGEGGVYQAIFWPNIDRGLDKDPLVWVGDVHAFFIDEHGLLWDDYSGNAPNTKRELWSEDANGDGILQDEEDWYPLDADGNPTKNYVLDGDRRITTFFNNVTNSTQICFNATVSTTGICAASDYYQTPSGAIELRDFENYLWSAKQQLAGITTANIGTNRGTHADGTWDYSENRRFIFTWNDLNNDGVVDADEVLDFVSGMNPDLSDSPAAPRNEFHQDFSVATPAELNDLIEWVRGDDLYEFDTNGNGTFELYNPNEDKNMNGIRDYVFRCRKYPDCDPTAVNSPPWLLGDIIHSTPTLVARPAEGFHFIYKDSDYSRFYRKYLNRRHMIYFGGNDGMLHAVNGGFYQAGRNKFLLCPPDPATNECSGSGIYPALGDEMWAYIPYNLQPHLKCLADPGYDDSNHKYFVDAPPRIFDVNIFPDDGPNGIHPGGWGTILVGYMRFGGAPTPAATLAPAPAAGKDTREFVSSYFILDITDPERPPTLLAEMTMKTDQVDSNLDGILDKDQFAKMGYTTAMPSVVVMRKDDGTSEWYLTLGNGPTTIKGENDQQGKVAVVQLNALTGVNAIDSNAKKAFRIPNEEPSASTAHFGRLLIDPASNGVESFVSDMVSVDFDIKAKDINGIIPYKTNAVYFGTVDGKGFATDPVTGKYWNGDGRLFRLVMNPSNGIDANGNQAYTSPATWQLKKLLDAQGPITAAPNIGYDGSNFWVYFGTGRFYAPEDKTDTSTQYFFGVKEPLDTTCKFAWNEKIDWWSGTAEAGAPIEPNPEVNPGKQGLMRTDQIRVIESRHSGFSVVGDYLYCEDGTPNCQILELTAVNQTSTDAAHTYYAFSDLENFIEGERCGAVLNNDKIGIDGWYRHFNDPRERSLGMPTLLGGLVTYTSYQPFADPCKAEGASYLFGVYYLTGTAWYENVFGTYKNAEDRSIVKDRLDLGTGLATTPSLQVGGGPNGANAYIQSSTGEIIPVGQQNLPSNPRSSRTSWRN